MDRTDKEQFEQLLKQSFGHAVGFSAHPNSLLWPVGTDERFPQLGLFHDGQLISTTRLEWVHTLERLNFKLHANYQLPNPSFPVACTSKAATRTNLKGQGLNSILRYFCIQQSLVWKVPYLISTMVEGSPRIFSMREMGYDFELNPIRWTGAYSSDKQAFIASLDLVRNGSHALAYLEKNLGAQIKSYEIQYDPQSVQIQV